MTYIEKFNERYESSIKDTLNFLKDYFTTDGAYTPKVLTPTITMNHLFVDLDIASGFKEGRVERDRVKYYLKRGGFEPSESSQFAITLSENDLKWVKNFFDNL
jgi:hypothetical protein